VVEGGELMAASLPERIAEAGQRGRQTGARLAIWVEPAAAEGSPAAGTPWLLYLVGRRDGRVLVEVVQVPEGTAPDVERSLALKVREAHDTLRQAEPDGALLAAEAAAAPGVDRASSPWGFRLALGPAAAALDGSAAGQWGLSMAVGAALHLGGRAREPGRVSLHAAAQLRWFAAAEVKAAAGSAELDELDPGLWLAGLYHAGRFAIGASSGLLARRVRVEAVASRSGERGAARELVWSIPIALELQLGLADRFALRIAPGLEINMNPETFAIEAVPVIELGRVRPGLELSLVVTDR
jgi:hypothetical protein